MCRETHSSVAGGLYRALAFLVQADVSPASRSARSRDNLSHDSDWQDVFVVGGTGVPD